MITLPKGLVLAKTWKKGDELEFILAVGGSIIIKKVIGRRLSNKSRLQFANNKQFIITLPKSLVLALGWEDKDIVEFMLDKNVDIVVKKIGKAVPKKKSKNKKKPGKRKTKTKKEKKKKSRKKKSKKRKTKKKKKRKR